MSKKEEATEKRGLGDLDTPILDVKGDPVRHRSEVRGLSLCADCREKLADFQGEPMTIRSVCVEVLERQELDKQNRPKHVAPRKKVQRRYLAQRVLIAGDEFELPIPDLNLIRDLVTETHDDYNNDVVDAVWKFVDPVGYRKAMEDVVEDEEPAEARDCCPAPGE